MKFNKSIGMILLAVFLIFDGLLGFGLNVGPAVFLLYIVALAAGVQRCCVHTHASHSEAATGIERGGIRNLGARLSLELAKSLGTRRERVRVMVLWETAKAEIM